ncbi:MAG: hypothetical protein AAGJ46_13130 [Planctomycetota bacterium]
MDDVKKKVLLDLFVSPWTVVPVVGGLSAWLISWGVDGSTLLNVAGLAGVLTGLGIQASRLVFGVEKLTERAQGYVLEKEREEQEQMLNELATRLRHDDEPRTEECLRRLRKLRAFFESEPPAGHATAAIKAKVDKLFEAAVRQLQKSIEMWEKSRKLPSGTRASLLEKRKEAVDEVVRTVNHLTRTVEQYHTFQVEDTDSELAKLRDELDATINVARRADQVIDEIGASKDYDESEFNSVERN